MFLFYDRYENHLTGEFVLEFEDIMWMEYDFLFYSADGRYDWDCTYRLPSETYLDRVCVSI